MINSKDTINMARRYVSSKVNFRADSPVTGDVNTLTHLKRTVETGSKAVGVGIEGTQKAIQAGLQGVTNTVNTLQSAAQQVIEPASEAFGAVGNVQDSITQPLSSVINSVTKLANGMLSFLGPEKPFPEDDYSSISELVTEAVFGAAGHAIQAIDANLHTMIGVPDSENAAKQLIKLEKKGDAACDASKGNLRMMIELPGMARQYDLCLNSRTAKNVIKQAAINPMIPLQNFGECLLSEGVLKPIDRSIRDVKNNIADVIGWVKQPSEIIPNMITAFNNISKFVHNGLAGEYLANPGHLIDTATCFQIKTNKDPDVDYQIVDIPHVMESIVSTQFLSGNKIEPTPYARKPDRKRCDHEDMCKI